MLTIKSGLTGFLVSLEENQGISVWVCFHFGIILTGLTASNEDKRETR